CRQYVPCSSSSTLDRLTLTLLVARIGTDHSHHTLAADDLAIAAHLLDRCCDFHASLLNPSDSSLLGPEHDACAAQVIRRQFDRDLVSRQDADVVHTHLPGNVPEHHVPV